MSSGVGVEEKGSLRMKLSTMLGVIMMKSREGERSEKLRGVGGWTEKVGEGGREEKKEARVLAEARSEGIAESVEWEGGRMGGMVYLGFSLLRT